MLWLPQRIPMKQQIEALLRQALTQLAIGCPIPAITIERPKDSAHGDFSTNIALILAKAAKMPSRALAEHLLQHIHADSALFKISIAGPGFINFTLSQTCLIQQGQDLWRSPTCGLTPTPTTTTVVIDYSSPNLAKEMHVGHLRSTIIGDAIANTLEAKGYRIIRQNHVGDWGTQFGMLLAHLEDQDHTQSANIVLHDLEDFYKAAKQRFDADTAFADRAREKVVLLQSGNRHCVSAWSTFIQLSLTHCQQIYQRLGVALQPGDVRAESAYNDSLPKIVETLREQGLLTESDGSLCVFLDEFKGKNNEPLPIIVQKRDGGFLYASTDLAAINYRQHELHADRILYIVDARQALHFQQVFSLAYTAGFASPSLKLEHIPFGMVLDKTGKPYKSRDGGVTKLSDLLDEAEKRAKALIASRASSASFSHKELEHMATVLGIASVKYADLSKNRESDYIFDWDTMISFDGNTAPYLLYACTRIQSLLQKAGVTDKMLDEAPFILQDEHEQRLLKQLLLFPEIIDLIIERSTPNTLCTYLYDLAGAFSTFYESCPIVNQSDYSIRSSRLKLSTLTARILKKGLSLLGISTLQRM